MAYQTPRKAARKRKLGALGNKTYAPKGDRLNRLQIAKRSGLDRATVTKHLAAEGAPKPDERMRWSFRAAMAWFEQVAPTAGGGTEMKRLREAKLRVEAEEAAFDFGVKRGEYIARKELAPGASAVMGQLTADMQAKFERELPARYDGRGLAERVKMNADAVDWVLRRLKHGLDKIS